MVGFGKAEWPPVSGKSSLLHPTIESEVTVASLGLVLNRLFFLLFRRTPTEGERGRESKREREGGREMERERERISQALKLLVDLKTSYQLRMERSLTSR